MVNLAMGIKVRKESLSKLIVKSLEIATEGAIILEELTYSAQMRALKGLPSSKNSHALKEAVRRLKNKGIVENEINEEGRIIIRLTNLGRSLLQENVEEIWDGKYRIVVWDIPENKRRVRNLFRRKMKEFGFRVWQKSVWVSRKNVTVPIRNLIKELGLDKWVCVIESDDETLHTLFDDRS